MCINMMCMDVTVVWYRLVVHTMLDTPTAPVAKTVECNRLTLQWKGILRYPSLVMAMFVIE